jgi:hypothetical protein
MIESDKPYEVGYGKPPAESRFVKGVSGNPRGRPKGSKNVFSVMQKAARERITVTQNGRVRTLTKLEAGATQLSNKAAGGDLRAIRELLLWSRQAEEAITAELPPDAMQEADRVVMASLVKRIQSSQNAPSTTAETKSSADHDKEED